MYKKTAKSTARKLLKNHNYMPTLNVVSEKGLGSQWYKKETFIDYVVWVGFH